VRITDIDVTQCEDGARITAAVGWEAGGRRADTIDFRYRGVDADVVATPADAVATAAFMPAMARGEDITIDAPISARLRAGMDEVASVWEPLMPGWRRPEVRADLADRSGLTPSLVAACFSAGVDSFYTVLRPRTEPIDTLLILREFTSHPGLLTMADEGVSRMSTAARGLGFEPIVVESNAFGFCAKHIPVHRVYSRAFSGAVLSAMALGLGAGIRRCLIAAGHPFGQDYPTGIDPLVRCWSTESVEVRLDADGVERAEKIRLIANNPIVLDTLTVCPQIRKPGDGPNCRRCDKCVETSLLLQREGVLQQCRTLGPIAPRTVRKTIVWPHRDLAFGRLHELTDDVEIKRAIASALRRSRVRRVFHPLGSLLRRWGLR
jgi:hypothetical protein